MTLRGWTLLAQALLVAGVPALAEIPVVPSDRARLVTEYRTAFVNEDWPAAGRAAHALLALEEGSRVPNDPVLVPALLNVASVEAELGNTTQAEAYVARATTLLDRQAAPDPSQRFARDVVLAKAWLRAERYDDAQRQCRRALTAAANVPAVTVRQKSQAYVLMLESARGEQDITFGNLVAKEMVKTEKAELGESAPARAPGLYEAASWYRYSSQMPRERDVLEEAVAVLEKAYGPDDQRLAYPLWKIGMSYLVGRDGAQESRAVLERAVALPAGTEPSDALERAQILASLGDHAVVFGESSASGQHYVAAWHLIALNPQLGANAANRVFGRPQSLYVKIPNEPFRGVKGGEHFADGVVTLGFTVTEHGLVEDLRIKDEEMGTQSLPTPTVQAFRTARYRPRILDGKPVATADQEFGLRFRLDNW